MKRVTATTLLAVSVFTLWASHASAAYVSYDSWFGLEVSDKDGAETNAIMISNGSGSNDYVITDSAGIEADGVDCTQDSSIQATCIGSTRSGNIGFAELGDGDDTLTVDATFSTFDIYGGDGSDTVTAGSANSTILGEDGEDWISPGFGSDSVIGGDGTDTISYSDRSTATSISPDGTTADGSETVVGSASGASEEQDKISSDIENIQGGSGDDALYGNENANRFSCGAGTDVVANADSSDTLDADCELASTPSDPGGSTPPSSTGGGSDGVGDNGSGSRTVSASKSGRLTIRSKTKTARLLKNRTLKVRVNCDVVAHSGTCGVSGLLKYRGKVVAITSDTVTERKNRWLIFKLKKAAYRKLRRTVNLSRKRHKKATLSLRLKASAVEAVTAMPATATTTTKLVVR